MNGEWVTKLKKSSGSSQYIIAIFIDIRRFTNFCQTVDSVDVATYIKKIYEKILSDYFPKSNYSKPMGDGLFIVINYNEENLIVLANEVIMNCITLIDKFPILLAEEPIISYPVPERLGIGITHGSACCINAENGEIIDFSGKTLNHAARLMDKARPSGIICDYNQFYKILNKDNRGYFNEDEIYLRGISENEPVKILYLKDKVIITEIDREPLISFTWDVITQEHTCKAIKELPIHYIIDLNKKPVKNEDISLEVTYDIVIDSKGYYEIYTYRYSDEEIKLEKVGKKYQINFNTKYIKQLLEERKMPDDNIITFELQYPV